MEDDEKTAPLPTGVTPEDGSLGVYPNTLKGIPKEAQARGHKPQNLGGKEKVISEEEDFVQEEKEEPVKDEEVKKENKQLLTLFLVIGGILIIFGATYFFVSSMGNFSYRETDFKTVKEGSLIFYNTNFPVYNLMTGKLVGDYNFYFRNDPRKLEKEIPIVGEITFRKNIVLDLTTENLFCEGDWNLATGNLMKLNLFGINVLSKNNSLKYSPSNEFTFITINEGNQTEIKQIDESSYEMNVANCEILKVAERLLIEATIRNNELNNK